MTVEHVELSEPIAEAPLLPNPRLIVFWWRDRPVGHARLSGTGPAPDLAALAREKIAPEVLAGAQAAAGDAPATNQTLSVTVVICTRDRPDALAHCLDSLSRQVRPPDQVVVVDNASIGDRTRQVAEAAGVTYIREDRPGLDIARNAGARAAKSDIVAYTDDDVRLHPHWLERLVTAFARPDIAAVTGLVLPAEVDTAAQDFFERHWGFGRGYKPNEFAAPFFRQDRWSGCPVWRIGAGANMAFRRAVFDDVGLFDERLDVGAAGCSGDSEYWHRLLSHGCTVRYEPAAVVFHYHRRDDLGLSRQIFFYMRGHAAALLVQFERTHNFGNLQRAFIMLPGWYVVRTLRCLMRRQTEKDRYLKEEIRGFLSGLLFYFRAPRPDAAAR